MATGTAQTGESSVVGSHRQRRLHVVLHRPVRGGSMAVAEGPPRLAPVRGLLRGDHVPRAHRLHPRSRRTPVGGGTVHRGRGAGLPPRPDPAK